VENEAAALIDGKDPQLERGIAEVLKAMDAAPKKLPGRPARSGENAEAVGTILADGSKNIDRVRRQLLRPRA